MAPPKNIPPAFPLRLTDAEWKLISSILERRSPKGGRPPTNLRRSLEGMRWVAANFKPWVDMPAEFGNWASVKRCYARMNERGVIAELLNAFPKRATKTGAAPTSTREIVGRQLACLQNLTERRSRGRRVKSARSIVCPQLETYVPSPAAVIPEPDGT